MEKQAINITPDEHAFYEKLTTSQKNNITPNHVEDSRPLWVILKAGLDKIPFIDLGFLKCHKK